ncbi:hypothetical protein OpiT1DRAFT_03177 [Opitutaceae bacterium TAV1]|nr:hypothetical protein OpiT1DRAFT_03177 [Opitutaceae bacterium TAV1]
MITRPPLPLLPILAICSILLAGPAFPAQATAGEGSLRAQIASLGNDAAGFTDSAPAFARWITYQQEILTRSLDDRLASASAIAETDAAEISREEQNLLRSVREAIALRREHIATLQAHPQKTFDVRDYGATGDGVANDAPAVRKAIADAVAYPNSRVHLSAGVYRLADLDHAIRNVPSPYFDGCERAPGVTPADLGSINGSPHLFISRAANLVISGDGPDKTLLLIGTAWETGIDIQNSRNVTLRDLALDYEKLPFTQGKVVNVIDNKTCDVTVDDGYPSPLDPHIRNARFGMVTRNFVKTAEGIVPLPAPSAPSYFTLSDIQKLPGDERPATYRFTIGSSGVHASSAARADELPDNALFVLYGRVSNERPLIKFDAVQNCALVNVGIHSSFSAGVLVKRSGLVELDACKIIPKPGTTRICSTNADGVFGQSNYLSPYIHDTLMTLNGDDFINTHANAMTIDDYAGRTFIARVNGHSHFLPGQRLIVVETASWQRKYASIIRKTTVRKTNGVLMMEVEMEDPIPGAIRSRKTLAAAGDKGRPDRLLNLDVTGPGAVVTDNELVYGYRLILRSANALVAGNHLLNRHNPGNFIILGTHSLEAWKANNITIRNNTIDSLGNILFAPQAPVPNRNLLIADNVIVNPEIRSDAQVFPARIFDSGLNHAVTLRGNVYRAPAD